MLRRVAMLAAVTVLATGLGACGSKEKEALRQKVANLEQQLARATSQVVEKEAAIASLEQSLQQAHDDAAKCRAERDTLKSDLTAARKKAGTTTRKR